MHNPQNAPQDMLESAGATLSMRIHAPIVFSDDGEVCLRYRLFEDLGMLGRKKSVSTTQNDGENARAYLRGCLTSRMDHSEAPNSSEQSKAYPTSPESMENPLGTEGPQTNDADNTCATTTRWFSIYMDRCLRVYSTSAAKGSPAGLFCCLLTSL